ncbi:MAG: histidine phosphatase family protein [Acidimicrobiia bacterium]|nr:histidine phosphatase family protein [Acidimicrobiia bacterium]
MRITLIRHGQPRWIEDGQPTNDPVLTALGRAQADALATRTAEWTIDELLVSPLRRCRETAAPIEATTGLRATVAPWLEEIRGPEWTDIPAEQIPSYFERARARHPDDWWDGLPGGESFRDFHARITTGLDDYLARRSIMRDAHRLFERFDDDARIVMVAHGGTNAVVIGALLGLEAVPWEWERFPLLHASVSILETTDIAGATTFQLTRLNHMVHLGRGDQTK